MPSSCWCACRTATAVQTSPGIAAATGIPEPTVAKVLKALAAGGLVASQRGARGGYRLMRPLGRDPDRRRDRRDRRADRADRLRRRLGRGVAKSQACARCAAAGTR